MPDKNKIIQNMLKESQDRIIKRQNEIATCLFLTGDPEVTDIREARKILHDQVVEQLNQEAPDRG